MKRFWQEVSVGADHGIALDGKPVRTPGRAQLAFPSMALAEAVATEWRAVEGEIDPRAMPLTGLANAAIDRIAADPHTFASGLARYAESDLLYYRTDFPLQLAEREAAAWDPLLAWARGRYDVHFETVEGVMPRAQPAATVARLGEAVAAFDAFALAGLSPLVTVSGSLIAALALVEGAAGADAIWAAAHVDEDWQAEMWGREPLAEAALAVRRADFDAGLRWLGLLKPRS